MLKKWSQFIFESNDTIKLTYKEELAKLGFKDPGKYGDIHHGASFGISPDEIESYFYTLDDSDLYLNSNYYRYIDPETGDNKNDIRIGDVVKAALQIRIHSRMGSVDHNGKLIKEIQRVLKKIVVVIKHRSKGEYDFNNVYIMDPENASDRDTDSDKNIYDRRIVSDNPFDMISFKDNTFKYTDDSKKPTIVKSSSSLDMYLVCEKEVTITEEMFYNYYDIAFENSDRIDGDNNIWSEFMLKDIAMYLFQDEEKVDTYFEPEEWDIMYHSETEYVMDDVVDSISDDNQKILLTHLFNTNGIDEINEVDDTDFENLEDVLDMDDSELKLILRRIDSDLINDIHSRYDGWMSDKYYKEAEEYIKNETTEYITDNMECDNVTFLDEEDGIDMIWIKFNPKTLVLDYDMDGYDISMVFEDSIHDIVESNFSDTYHNDISWDSYFANNIYLDDDDVNAIIKDIFIENNIK